MSSIGAVVFDLGGTLEDVYYDEAIRQDAARGLHALLVQRGLEPGLAPPDLYGAVESGMAAYQRWREQTNVELPPAQVWTEYVFPDHRFAAGLAAAAEELTFYYENTFYRRALRPEAPGALEALHRRGLRLAVVSNIISRELVPRNLASYGVAHYFNPILTSAELGIRKPDPRIFLEAARRMGLSPGACAYVGDTVSRDIAGARRAGYGRAIQIRSFLTGKADRETDTEIPDAVVRDLMEVVPLVTGAGVAETRGDTGRIGPGRAL